MLRAVGGRISPGCRSGSADVMSGLGVISEPAGLTVRLAPGLALVWPRARCAMWRTASVGGLVLSSSNTGAVRTDPGRTLVTPGRRVGVEAEPFGHRSVGVPDGGEDSTEVPDGIHARVSSSTPSAPSHRRPRIPRVLPRAARSRCCARPASFDAVESAPRPARLPCVSRQRRPSATRASSSASLRCRRARVRAGQGIERPGRRVIFDPWITQVLRQSPPRPLA